MSFTLNINIQTITFYYRWNGSPTLLIRPIFDTKSQITFAYNITNTQ